MQKVLFLAVVMYDGYGVPVVLQQLIPEFQKRDVECAVICCHGDMAGLNCPIYQIGNDLQKTREIADRIKPDIICALTSPFFEILPDLSKNYKCWAWEYGDPTPELFSTDAEERSAIIKNKQENVYPFLSGNVLGCSYFIKHDINFIAAKTVHLGSDHATDFGVKKIDLTSKAPIKIGTLMRIGQGEAYYKGNQDFLDFVRYARKNGILIEPHVAGRGSLEDAANFNQMGIETHLNLSDVDKYKYLRSLDIFVSFSLWEGFNLPVVEAQAVGTFSLCLDIGAHPEVSPFLLNSPWDVLRYVKRAQTDKAWLQQVSKQCYFFAREKFQWKQTAEKILQLLFAHEN